MEYGVAQATGCHTWGESYEHLLKMLEEAIQGWLEVASERELEPRQQLVEICIKSVSGKALCKIVEKFGWKLKRIVGSHHIYAKEQFDNSLNSCSWK